MTDKEKRSEKQLVLAIKIGDQDAFRYILDTYQESIIRVCLGFVGNMEDAEDLAQEVFIQLHKSKSSFRGDAKLSTWLYRVAVNKSINHIRSGKNRKITDHIDSNSNLPGRSDEYADSNLSRADHKNALDKAINSLPYKQKTAFILQKYEDLSYEDISGIMDISLSSVQSLIFRARRNLQDSLKEYYENNLK